MSRLHILFAGALVLPVAVESPQPPGSSATSVSVAGGGGVLAVVTRGCNGQVLSADKLRFRDAAVAVEHRFSGPASVGVRAGVTSLGSQNVTNRYVNPYASFDWQWVGIGGGYIRSSDFLYLGEETYDGDRRDFGSGHLRVGLDAGPYLLIRVAEGVPLYSDGGVSELGIGFSPHSRVRALMTLSGIPYDGPGLGLHTEVEMRPSLHLDLGGHLGSSAGIEEYGLSVGLTYRAVHAALR